MKPSVMTADFSRRDFLKHGSIFALLAGASVSAATSKVNAQNKSRPPLIDQRIDGLWSQYGNIRVINIDDKGKTLSLPFAFNAPDDRAAIDLTTRMPTVRFGKDKTRLLLTPKGISFEEGDKEVPWSKASVKRLLEVFKADQQLSKDALALRLAIYATYPEYIAYKKSQPSKKLFAQRSKTSKQLKEFGKKPSGVQCTVETVVEYVTKEVVEYVDDILTAAEQLSRCVDRCYDRYLRGSRDDYWEYGLCDTACLAQSFEDVVVDTIEVVKTIVEPVERLVLRCALEKIPKGIFPTPFDGRALPDFLGFAGASGTSKPKFSPKVIDAAINVVTKMVKTLPPAIKCIAQGQWDLVTLEDINIDIPIIERAPLGITVCMDHDCAMKLIGGGLRKDAFTIIETLTGLAIAVGTVAAAPVGTTFAEGTMAAAVSSTIAAIGIEAALLPIVCQIVIALLVVLIVLMIHLVIVAGEIVVLESLGLIDNGICITHPSVPIAVIGAINPVAGLLALANIPLVVTAREP